MLVRTLRRIAPALLLTVLSPLIAEFLLADFTIRNLGLLVVFVPLYGCGALLLRELTRRTGRGWPTLLLLAIAYALLEEAFLTQSLFNPDYVGQRLLDYGFIPAMGTSLNWTFFVLSIHVVWSVATPILIAEGTAGAAREDPWLGRPGLVVTIVLFALGCAATGAFSLQSSPFVASPAQFASAAVLIALVVVAAFTAIPPLRSAAAPPAGTSPAPWIVLVTTLALAIAYLAAEPLARSRGLHPAISVIARLACEAAAAVLLWAWSTRAGWTPRHYLAVGAATTLTYGLFGLSSLLSGHTNLGAPVNQVDVVGQVAMTAIVLLIAARAARATA